MYESYYWLYLELWINFVSASIKGQPLYKGQKVHSQCVHYTEVPLYLCVYYIATIYITLLMCTRLFLREGTTQVMYGSLLDGTSKDGGKLMNIIYAV